MSGTKITLMIKYGGWKIMKKLVSGYFSFDKKHIFNMFRDYPHELTDEQKKIFDEENPYWANFFKDRAV